MTIKNYELCEIHGFSDASEKEYACVTYFRFLPDNKYSMFFIMAKSKVAPLKTVSILRLELLGAVLLEKLLTVIHENFKRKINISRIFAWTDSSIALKWIKSPPYKYKTFMANRISYIQEKITPELWHYVSTDNNPANVASRGLLSSELINNKMWFSGPIWLHLYKRDAEIEEKSQTFLAFVEENLLIYSTLSKLKSVLAYVLRFLHNLRSPTDKNCGPLSNLEKREALMTLVKYI